MIIFAGKRTLPYRPHLDHLRKQAKVRLDEMRVSAPEARLADAQLAVAREYGFASWGKLRTEVFRRAAAGQESRLRARRRRTPAAARYRERSEAFAEQVAQVESQTGFFLSGAATNVVMLFVFVAIFTSLWTFLVGVPG
ncbi:MAG: hypothetical protein K1X51_05135 [Rhodospirillaceae bacterium]|nr:hypothetical protein [Rhodospirillaceae bacterium]